MDRFDIHVDVPNVTEKILQNNEYEKQEPSEVVRKRVIAARERPYKRCNTLNSKLSSSQIEQNCKLSDENRLLLQQAITKLNISTRGLHRILKVARTIADLANSNVIETRHLTEALSFRNDIGKN